MRQYRLSLPLVLGLCLIAVIGCAEQTGATVSPAPVPPPRPGMARVWFFRPSLTPQFGAVAAFAPMVYVNDQPIAAIPAGTEFYRDFRPGTYRFTVQPLGLPTAQATSLQLVPDTQSFLQVDWIQSWTQGYPPASWSFAPNTFGILAANPQVAQAYLPTLAYLGER
jgi:hypothetical protein